MSRYTLNTRKTFRFVAKIGHMILKILKRIFIRNICLQNNECRSVQNRFTEMISDAVHALLLKLLEVESQNPLPVKVFRQKDLLSYQHISDNRSTALFERLNPFRYLYLFRGIATCEHTVLSVRRRAGHILTYACHDDRRFITFISHLTSPLRLSALNRDIVCAANDSVDIRRSGFSDHPKAILAIRCLCCIIHQCDNSSS